MLPQQKKEARMSPISPAPAPGSESTGPESTGPESTDPGSVGRGATGPSIVWFRDDLRVADHPALHAAVLRGQPIVAVYILDEESEGIRALGGAVKWWLEHSIRSLRASLEELGGSLVLRRGPAEPIITELARTTGAGAVLWNRRYGLAERNVDTRIKSGLRAAGIDVQSFAGSLLFEPWTIRTGAGNPYSVFTPFWRNCTSSAPPRAPYLAPVSLDNGSAGVPSDELAGWGLLPVSPDWAGGLRESWTPGEAAAQQLLTVFLDENVSRYAGERDEPAKTVTSRLSPYLRFGEISPYQIWHATQEVLRGATADTVHGAETARSATRFLTEIGWREFSYHVLFHAPDLATVNLKREFDSLPWPPLNARILTAWQQGRTGIPLVDAGMRELWQTGSMHNRVRMVAASFLIKNLRVDWRVGEQWFWDTLVDADAASNPFGWQWVAGSGADAAPYFRVFNPELQASRFDPRAEYIRRYIPEYDTPGYPSPIVDLGESRKLALAAYEDVKNVKISRENALVGLIPEE
jgi:deoxyribodipyrimidine photo-lyase